MELPRQFSKNRFPVESRVVHYDDSAFPQPGQQAGFDPIFKDNGGGRSGITKGRYCPAAVLGGSHIDVPESCAAYGIVDGYAPLRARFLTA
jgi:hypothetical protein